jgi:hypothetical protein
MPAPNLFRAGLVSFATISSVLGCSPATKDEASPAVTAPMASPGAVETVNAPATGSAPTTGTAAGGEGTPQLDFGADGPPGAEAAVCVGQVSKAEFVPVDLFIMLDISGSMLEMTPAGIDKWTAVKSALRSFIEAPASNGLGVGIQYFPLSKPGVPDLCTSDAECGPAGPCMIDVCLGALTSLGGRVPCQTDLDCQDAITQVDLGPCGAIGACSDDPSFLCQIPGLPCITNTGPIGLCQPNRTGICRDRLICEAPTYGIPAVEIATLPEAAPGLLASIEAQAPEGGTPSGPALSGAITHARQWALTHPGHAVIALLATDGLPTDCAPLDVAGSSEIAAAGFTGSPSVRTFAIGVFGTDDPAGPSNLDAIARAGGTESAFVIDPGEDIAAQFLVALNAIRGTQLACEFELPAAADGETLDFGLVNVDLSDASGKTRISKVTGGDACGEENGWYYDDELNPHRIITCPASCARFRSAAAGASVEIQLGCRTVIR